MSEFAEYKDRLDMREQLARIDKAQAEIQKYAAETRKLQIETKIMPIQALIVSMTAVGGAFLAGAGFLRLLQLH